MGSYDCCCCIPIRAGVLIIALLSSALYIFSTVSLLINRSSLTAADGEVSSTTMTAIFYTEVAVSVIFASSSLFGVIGSITQNRGMISVFKGLYWTITIIEFIVSIACIIVLCLGRGYLLETCISRYEKDYPTDSVAVATEACGRGVEILLIVIPIVLVLISCIEFYFATVISSYATRLRRTNLHEKLRNLEDFPEPPSKNEFY